MADRGKVFDALRNCVTEPKCKDCPWEDCEKIGCKRTTVPVTLLLDTLKVLKEQQEIIACFQALKEQPEQKHGHWISVIKDNGHYTCSCCGTGRYMNFVPNYCSECGAKMDEEVTQDG